MQTISLPFPQILPLFHKLSFQFNHMSPHYLQAECTALTASFSNSVVQWFMLFIRHPILYKKYHMHLKGFKSRRYRSRTASYPWICNSSYTNLVGWPSPQCCTSYSYNVVLTNFICPLFLKRGSSGLFSRTLCHCPWQSASLVAYLAEVFLSAYLLKFSTSIPLR